MTYWNPLQRERVRYVEGGGVCETWQTFRNESEQNLYLEALAFRDSSSADIRAIARYCAADLRGLDALACAHRFVQGWIAYAPDTSEDILQSPLYTLRRGCGDCKAQSTLFASLAYAIDPHRQVRIVSMGQSEDLPSHVLCLVQTATGQPPPAPRWIPDDKGSIDGWCYAETTVPGVAFGAPPSTLESRQYVGR